MTVTKKFLMLLLFLLCLNSGAAYAAISANDAVHLYSDTLINEDDDVYYRNWHEQSIGPNYFDNGYFYQLRDVSGVYDRHTIAGSQWFAVTYENWYKLRYTDLTLGEDYGIFWRTLGGEAPTINIVTSADLLHDFDYIYIDEPEPYPESYYHDRAMDPLVNLFLVIKEGSGEFNINFANHYARHFPYWWDESPGNTNAYVPSTNERIYYYDANGVYDLNSPRNTLYTISGDEIYSGSSTTLIYTISSDERAIVETSGDIAYTYSAPKTIGSRTYIDVYDSNGNLAYRVDNSTGYIYYTSRTVREDLNMTLEDYSVRVQPDQAQDVAPENYLQAKFNISAQDPTEYGSKTGTLSFRQSAKLDTGYSGWRENSLIPVVVANVHDGPASDPGNELYFDMILSDTAGDVLNRIKFRWGADEDLTQDLGNIFLASSANTNAPQYSLETRITNRTGTRYRVQRYDSLSWSSGTSSQDVGNNLPAHWMFDLTSDGYQSLPARFYLDTHSQIAPGVITVYNGGIDMTYGTSKSFRLYPFNSSSYKTLTLTYQRIRDMNATAAQSFTYGAGISSARGLAFEEGFVDRGYSGTEAYRNTSEKLTNIMGLPPAMVTGSENIGEIYTAINSGASAYPNMGSSRYYPIRFEIDVTDLITVSHDYETVTSYDASGDAIGSEDIDLGPAEIPLLPVTIRFEIPRGDELLTEANWAKLYDTSNAQTLLQRFMQFGTIGVRSPNTDELDVDLLTALDGEISSSAVGSSGLNRFIKAFLIEDKDDRTNDKLVLEFIAFMADASSSRTNKTAYIRTFEDDNVPYILIGDGLQDDKWTLSFFVTGAGAIDETDDNSSNNNGDNSDNNSTTSGDKSGIKKGGGGGGGCNALGLSILILFALAFKLRKI
ncbi:MAG: hypothetical protein IJ576_00935 [Synergistaceae bacterium]|nr:hypothetical protein [Synergistaceae bacterium]